MNSNDSKIDNETCKKILDFLSHKISGKTYSLVPYSTNKIGVAFGHNTFYCDDNARWYSTNALSRHICKDIVMDIVKASHTSYPLQIFCIDRNRIMFKPIISKNTTIEQRMTMMDLEEDE